MKPIPVKQIAPVHSEQSSTGRFSIRSLEKLMGDSDMLHELHRHDFYFILFIEKGRGAHEVDFTRYEVHDQSIFILRPGQVHRLTLKAGSRGFLLEFDPSFYQPANRVTDQRWKKAAARNCYKPGAQKFRKLNGLVKAIFDEFTAKAEGYAEAIGANLDLFVIELTRQSDERGISAEPGTNYANDRFEELLRLLETNISSMKTVSDYTTKLNLSAYQLNAITKTLVGKTVSGLIDEQIILEAKRHLLATPNQVKDIADQLGYEDPSYFIRFFKKQTGQSPEAFRKNFK